MSQWLKRWSTLIVGLFMTFGAFTSVADKWFAYAAGLMLGFGLAEMLVKWAWKVADDLEAARRALADVNAALQRESETAK